MVGRTSALLSIVKRQAGDVAGRKKARPGRFWSSTPATCTGKGNLFFNVRVSIVLKSRELRPSQPTRKHLGDGRRSPTDNAPSPLALLVVLRVPVRSVPHPPPFITNPPPRASCVLWFRRDGCPNLGHIVPSSPSCQLPLVRRNQSRATLSPTGSAAVHGRVLSASVADLFCWPVETSVERLSRRPVLLASGNESRATLAPTHPAVNRGGATSK